jgi:hypothetical protein
MRLASGSERIVGGEEPTVAHLCVRARVLILPMACRISRKAVFF